MKKWDPSAHLERLREPLEHLEGIRQEVLTKASKGQRLMIFWVLGSLLLGFGLTAASGEGFMMVFGVVAAVIAALIIYQNYIGSGYQRYQLMFKAGCIEPLVKSVEPGMNYEPAKGISEQLFRAVGLFSSPDRYSCEDLFHGTIGKTHIMFSEVHAEEKHTSRDSNGNTKTTWSTIFQGIFLIADFHKDFRSPVSVMPDFAEKSFGWFGRKLQKIGGGLQRMENPEFEKFFVVRGNDPVEARYILTPSMQDCLVDLRKRVGDGVCIGFRDSKVTLAIPENANWFEGNVKTPAFDRQQIEQLLAQFWSCFRIVEDLDLNTRIWTKD